jgi:hypothetical protein
VRTLVGTLASYGSGWGSGRRTNRLASYWEDIFAMTPEQASALVTGGFAASRRACG